MSKIYKQIKELEAKADLIEIIRDHGISDGNRLTSFGQDFVYTCIQHGIPNGEIAKLLGVTTSAISQRANKFKED